MFGNLFSRIRLNRNLKKGGDIGLSSAYDMVQSELIHLRQQLAETIENKKRLEEIITNTSSTDKKVTTQSQIQAADFVLQDQQRRLAAIQTLCESAFNTKRLFHACTSFGSLREELSIHKDAAMHLCLKYLFEIHGFSPKRKTWFDARQGFSAFEPRSEYPSDERITSVFGELQKEVAALCILAVDDGRCEQSELEDAGTAVSKMVRELQQSLDKRREKSDEWKKRAEVATRVNLPDMAVQSEQRMKDWEHDYAALSNAMAPLLEFDNALKSRLEASGPQD